MSLTPSPSLVPAGPLRHADRPPSRPPLVLGRVVVDPPVVLAPMAGVTDRAYRRLCRRFGGGLFVSEMLTSRAIVEGNARTLRMASFAPDEPIRSVQLYGVDPAVVHDAVRRLVGEIGAHHVDLNVGCPVPKITRNGGGAALPARRRLFERVVEAAVRAAGDVPVTVKMRMGLDAHHHTFLDAGRMAAGAGAAAVTLHARTAAQLYSGAADWSAIAALKDALGPMPVLGNGDIWEAADARCMTDQTGCDGVVIGRGCLGRPWLFADLEREARGEEPVPHPRLGEVVDIMLEHAHSLVEEHGEIAGVRRFRKHVKWYLTGFPVGAAVRRRGQAVSTLADLRVLLDDLDRSSQVDGRVVARPRGTTRGPQRVTLPDGWLDRIDDAVDPESDDRVAPGG